MTDRTGIQDINKRYTTFAELHMWYFVLHGLGRGRFRTRLGVLAAMRKIIFAINNAVYGADSKARCELKAK
jgi:hypothetical protein